MGMDRIFLEGMVFYGYHGVNQPEKESGQRFIVDLVVERDLKVPGKTDDIKDTISYSELFELVREIMEGPSRNLLERLAEEITNIVLASHDVETVSVTIKKPEVPIKGSLMSYAAVEIKRKKQKRTR